MGTTADSGAEAGDAGNTGNARVDYDRGRRARRAERFAAGERFTPERADERDDDDDVNVNRVERVASVLGGGALALYGAKRRDLTGLLLGVVGGALVQRGVSGHCGVYGALGVSSADDERAADSHRPMQQHGPNAVLDASKAERIEHAVTIGREPAELYRYWRNLENLPRIMAHLESVTVLDATRSHWTAKAPAGMTVEWDAVIHNEIPNELIAWKSEEGASVPNAGSVRFRAAPGGLGTELRVILEYAPPAGKLGVAIAKMFGEEPAQQVREDLRRFKETMEAGEVVP